MPDHIPKTLPPEVDEEGDLVFDEVPAVQGVKLRGKDGTKRRYLLMDMGGPGLAIWMRTIATRVKTGKRGVNPQDSNFRDFQASLISLCLKEEDGRTPVPFDTIKAWPAKLLNGLFHQCQLMNGLNDEGLEAVKKDTEPPNGDGTS